MNPVTALLALLILAAPVAYVAPGYIGRRGPFRVTLLALTGAWLLWLEAERGGVLTLEQEGIAFVSDGLTVIMGALVLLLGTFIVLYSGVCMAGERGTRGYYALLLALMAFIIAMTYAADLFNLWLWFEGMAIAAYALVAFYRNDRTSLEAAVKYFVQSAAGSTLILAGIALVLMEAGSITLADVRLVEGSSALRLAGALFVIGFGVKAALVPLHTWLPDAHAQAPSGISAALSGVVIGAGLVALMRMLSALGDAAAAFGTLLIAFAMLNIVVGNVLALRQTQVKRLLAYSSVAHIGYIALGLGVGISTGENLALSGGMLHLLAHGLMKGLAFLAVGALLYVLVAGHGGHPALQLDDLSGAARRYPLVSLALVVALLGLGGLPPTVGFMSKWQVFVGSMAAQDTVITLMVIVAGFGSIISLAYYMPIVNRLYRQHTSTLIEGGARMPLAVTVPLVVLALLVVGLGLLPGLVDGLVNPAGNALAAAFGLP